MEIIEARKVILDVFVSPSAVRYPVWRVWS
jgi:hypothetical protein